MPPPATPSAVEAAPKPPTATETMAATRPDVLPPIDVGAWTRIGGVFQNGSDPKKLNDFHMDNEYVELHAGGKVHKKVGVTLNLNANMTNFSAASVAVMDAIISFDLQDEFHVWAGHLLVPVDRSNASGPFFMIPWNYPGFFATIVAAPKEGPSGRNNGVVVWGDIQGGKLTYLAGVFDQGDVSTSPLYSGRLRLALWDEEPGFWGNGSYFGDKDLLTIGVGGQYQKKGSGPDKAWTDINADVLLEKKLGGGSFVTGEAAYYHYGVNDSTPAALNIPAAVNISDAFYVLAAYATPTVGVGNIQPSVRYQWAKPKGDGFSKAWDLDVGLAYLIKGPALRLLATYSHAKFGDYSSNSIQLGAQAIFF
jgi:hypothetical protein